MKKIFFFSFLLISLAGFGQYTPPGYTPLVFSYGNWYTRVHADSALHIPRKAINIVNDLDTTPQLFVRNDTLVMSAHGIFKDIIGGGGGGAFTGDEIGIHLSGTVFSIKATYPGQSSIVQVGTITSGIWTSTAIADPFIASSAVWNAKLSSALTTNHIFIGVAGVATDVAMSGDATIVAAGTLTLASTIAAGNCTSCNLTYDAKGRITVAANGTPGAAPFPDNSAIIKNNADNTRLAILDASLIATATTRTWKFPNYNGTFATITAAQSFTGLQSFPNSINLNGASTTNYVWTATDGVGNGAWAINTAGMNQLTGDGTAGPGTGSQALTLATVNANVGTWGDGTHVPQVTVNGKGLITGVALITLTTGGFSETTALASSNYTVPGGTRIQVTLPDLTGQANRNVILQAAPVSGDEVIIENNNTAPSTFVWTFTNATVKDYTGSPVTTLTNLTVYRMYWNSAGSYYKISN